MRDFLKGGNWSKGWAAGYFRVYTESPWEVSPGWNYDIEGLPDRWVRIVLGETGWTKIVFDTNVKIIEDQELK